MILLVFILFFAFIGFGFDYFYLQNLTSPSYIEIKKPFIPYGTIIALIIAALLTINAFINGINMIVEATGARTPNETNLKEIQLLNVVGEMSLAAGIPMPKVYIVPDRDLNAFATGFSPQKAYVFVTEGLLNELNREELQAVVAHEISHIRFYDIRLMTLIVTLMNTIAMISDFIARSSRRTSYSSSRSRKSSGGEAILFFIWVILLILSPIVSRILAMAISRQREYLADAGAAELTRNPKALISALEKIRQAVSPTRSMKDSVAYLCITDPRGSYIEEKTGFWAELFATHPPMEKRILALKLMAYEKAN